MAQGWEIQSRGTNCRERISWRASQVSRGTLRQAMLLLQEDGLIINHQGKGNIVLSNQDMSKSGLEDWESHCGFLQ